MSVQCTDFLKFAIDSSARGDEIGYRNAVARSYYCAYHRVNGMMKKGPKDSHQGLIDYLHGDAWRLSCELYEKKYLVALAHTLKAMKDQRVISDYGLNDSVDKMNSDAAIATCNKLLDRCRDMAIPS